MENDNNPGVQLTAGKIRHYLENKPDNFFKLAQRIMDKGKVQTEIEKINFECFPKEDIKLFKVRDVDKARSLKNTLAAFEPDPENQSKLVLNILKDAVPVDRMLALLSEVYGIKNP